MALHPTSWRASAAPTRTGLGPAIHRVMAWWLHIPALVFVAVALSTVCGADPGEDRQVDARGDPLPQGGVARLGSLRATHPAAILALVVVPGGSRIVTADERGSIRSWRAADGRLLWEVRDKTSVRALACSADGALLAVGGDEGVLRVLDPATGAGRLILLGHRGAVRALAFDPQGNLLSGSSGESMVRSWEANTGRELCAVRLLASANAITVSADGESVAVAAGLTVEVFDRGIGGAAPRRLAHPRQAFAVAFVGARTLVSASDDTSIRIWDTRRGEMLRELKGHEDGVHALAASPAGDLLASGGEDAVVRLWRMPAGEPIAVLRGSEGRVHALAFLPNQRVLLSAGDDRRLRFWGLGVNRCLEVVQGHVGRVVGVNFLPDGERVLTAGADGTVRLWSVRRGTQLRVVDVKRRLTCLSHSTESFAVGDSIGRVVLGTLAPDAVPERVIEAHTRWVNAVALSSDGRTLVTGAQDNTLRVWDARTGARRQSFEDHEDGVRCVDISADGTSVAYGCWDGLVRVRDLETGKIRWSACHARSGVLGVRFVGSGSVATAGADGTLRVWDARTGRQTAATRLGPHRLFALAVGPGGDSMAVGDECGTVALLRLDNRAKTTLGVHQGYVNDLAFSPDGRLLVSVSADGTGLVWRIMGH